MGRGKLVFKGDKPTKKKSKTKRSVVDAPASSATEVGVALSPSSVPQVAPLTTPAMDEATPELQARPNPRVESGQGQITTSGAVVSGHGTNLQTIFRWGDAMIASINGRDEMRVITMVLSDVSCAISTPFSSDLRSPSEFRFVRKPRDVRREKAEGKMQSKAEKDDEERRAFGTYGGNVLVYRETTVNGSYRIRRENVLSDTTRSDLLDMRSKKKSDKYC